MPPPGTRCPLRGFHGKGQAAAPRSGSTAVSLRAGYREGTVSGSVPVLVYPVIPWGIGKNTGQQKKKNPICEQQREASFYIPLLFSI